MSEHLSKNSHAYKLLEQKFDAGEISSDCPKEVWLSELIFQKYKLDNFHTTFNKLKTIKGFLVCDDVGKKTIAEGITEAQGNSVGMLGDLKDVKVSVKDAAGSAELSIVTLANTVLAKYNDLNWLEVDYTPFHVCAEIDATSSHWKILAVAVHLPSGMKAEDHLESSVFYDGTVFELKYLRQPLMLNEKVLTLSGLLLPAPTTPSSVKKPSV